MSAAALERPEKVPVFEERSGATGTYELAIRLPPQAIAGIQATQQRVARNRSISEKQVANESISQQHRGMQPNKQEPKDADLQVQIPPRRLELKTLVTRS